MKTTFLFAAVLLFTITACDLSHKIGIENNSVTDGNNTTNECTTVEAFDISSIKNLSQAVDARELFASIGFKDIADKLDATIDTLVQDAIADALPINHPTIGEEFAVNKNVIQAVMAECSYGFATLDKLMLTNEELNKIDKDALKKLSEEERKALRTKLEDSHAAMRGLDLMLAVSSDLKDEKYKSLEERIKATGGDGDVSIHNNFKPAFFCSFCKIITDFSNCKIANNKLIRMCEQALSGSLFDAKELELKVLIEKNNSGLKARIDEMKIELPAALEVAEQNLKDAEAACKQKNSGACDSIDALKEIVATLKLAIEAFNKDAVAYAAKNDATCISLIAEIEAAKAELTRLDSPCDDPEEGEGKK